MFNSVHYVDLTHTVCSDMPSWSGSCPFHAEIKRDYDEGVRVLKYKMHASTGTHIDAPSHFFREGMHVADLALENLIVSCCMIDISSKRHEALQLEIEDIEAYEKKHGKIPKQSFVIARTGWEAFWKDSARYRNIKEDGVMRFPTFSKKAATYLVEKEIAGIGIDTLSPDPADSDHPVHHIVLGAGKYIVENLCNLSKLPPSGAFAIILPIKIKEGAEAPIRCVGVIPRELKHG